MSRVTTGTLQGPAGPLEYVLNEPDETGAARRAALLCHPHPLFGGTMHTRIVFHMNRALNDLGLPVLRFNFRGVGRSGGEHDEGRGEMDDALAALAFLRERYRLPVVLGGFSFGSAVVLNLLASRELPEVERALIAGVPLTGRPMPAPLRWMGPKLFLSGTEDKFGPVEAVRAYVNRLEEPKQLLLFDGADHFLTGRMDEFRATLAANLDFEEQAGWV